MKNHNHDLVHQLSENADSIWRFDEYIKNAESCPTCAAMWQTLKEASQKLEQILLEEIKRHISENRFD
ncbi:MAG: hypothetical protein Q8L57_02890 [bacterium]|nr:hypothetical protein [bacterium]